jgi:hypothetical protein
MLVKLTPFFTLQVSIGSDEFTSPLPAGKTSKLSSKMGTTFESTESVNSMLIFILYIPILKHSGINSQAKCTLTQLFSLKKPVIREIAPYWSISPTFY